MARSRPKPARRSLATADIDRWLPGLPHAVREWLADQPQIVAFFLDLEQQVCAGTVSRVDVVQLAQRWSETLPSARGRVVRLRRIAHQADLPLNLPATEARAPRPRGEGSWRRR